MDQSREEELVKMLGEEVAFMREERAMSKLIQELSQNLANKVKSINNHELTPEYVKFMFALGVYIRLLKNQPIDEIVADITERAKFTSKNGES